MDFNTISERIHDSDSEVNERMVHWLHQFVEGEISKNMLKNVFKKAYENQEHIPTPWKVTGDFVKEIMS